MSKSALSPIEKAVKESLDRYFFDDPSPYFVVGVSGGIDSMSLLYALKELGVSALAVHLNYQKRGEDSDKDAELVERVASKWGFECYIEEIVPSESTGQNFQQWARKRRYELYDRLAKQKDANGIAVAHHEDDQVETILQKIFRGAGLASWSGMEVWNGRIFRPLLEVSRAQIEEYATDNDVPYRTDDSNLENDFARNLLRNEWLNQLGDFFPGWKKNVLRVSEQADNYNEAVSWIAEQLTDEHGIKREAFHSLDEGVQKAVVLFLLKQRDSGLQISHDSLDRAEELAELQTGKKIELTPRFSLLRDRSHYVIEENEQRTFRPVTLGRDELETSSYSLGEIALSIVPYSDPDFETVLYMDADKISWPVTVRSWQYGDRFQPLGMDGHQKVADHLTNQKVSAAYKEKALVIESFEETISALIFPPIKNQLPPGTVSEQVKCDPRTTHCLEIKYRK